MADNNHSRFIRFGPFELDLRTGELSKGGVAIKIQQQPLQLLVTLLSRRGDVITREELRQQLWPEDTFVDFEHGLNAAIKRLRDVLGDSAENPLYVETLSRRGYRFIASTSADTGPPTTGVGTQSQSGSAVPHARFKGLPYGRIGALIFFVASLSVIAYLGWPQLRFMFTAVNSEPPAMKVVPITSAPGAETEPAFSPDGREIAFSVDENGAGANLYVKLIGSDKPLKVTQGPGRACCPAWSPDGRYLAFGRCGGGDHGLFLVPVLGGPERKLSPHGVCTGGAISWSPEGKFLAIADKDGRDAPWSIFQFSLDTRESHRLTTPPAHIIGDHIPAISPDGQMVAFRRINTPWSTDIYVQSLAGGDAKRVTFDSSFVNGIAWTGDSKSIVYASNRAGGMRLWRVPASGGISEALPVGGGGALHPAISRQGDRLAYQQGGFHTNIWRVPVSQARGRLRAGAAVKFIASTLGDGGPQYSPDGSKIAFHSMRSGNGEVWLCDRECSDPIQLTSLGVLSGSPRWSPDGTRIALDVHRARNSQIFVVNAEGGKPRQVTSGDYEHSVPGWSRDGRWIYFASNRTGGWQLWKVPAEGGESLQVTKEGGFSAFESPDRTQVYYTKESGPGIYQVAPKGGEERELLSVALAGWGYWGVTDKGIYFIRKHADRQFTIDFFDFVTHRTSEITTVARPPYSEVGDFAVSPDGSSILYSQVEGDADIMLVENFH
jgi:Tol biopolymer transport system component/DNA-binding winged helix-turn-helix (wHTH) protein